MENPFNYPINNFIADINKFIDNIEYYSDIESDSDSDLDDDIDSDIDSDTDTDTDSDSKLNKIKKLQIIFIDI